MLSHGSNLNRSPFTSFRRPFTSFSIDNGKTTPLISISIAAISISCALSLSTSTGSSAASEDQPTIAKDSVQLTAFTFNVYRKNYDTWSWVPRISYRVNGPIPSGSQLYVEF